MSEQTSLDDFNAGGKFDNPERVWLISDTHFDHYNIIRYSGRPFVDVAHMNEALVRNWNSTVRKGDLVFFLGDLAFGSPANKNMWLRRLKGDVKVILGNHDFGLKGYKWARLSFNGKKFLLIHNPAEIPIEWDGWVINGHVHRGAPLIDSVNKRVNVCVEAIKYRPVSLRMVYDLIRVEEILAEKKGRVTPYQQISCTEPQ